MKKIKMKLHQLYESKYFPFIILFLVVFLLHLFMKPLIMDDGYFTHVLDKRALLDWLQYRYHTWSSRLLIEIVIVFLLHINFFFWRIIDSLMFVILGITISKLFVNKNIRQNNWFIVVLMLIVPFEVLSSAGWLATSLNYLWPLTFGLISLIPIKKIFSNEKISKIEYVLYALALLFATNQEQMALVIGTIYFGLFIYQFIKGKPRYYIIFMMLLSIFNLSFIFASPGNYFRLAYEANRWYVDFNMLSLVDKLVLGITSTMANLIFKPTILFALITAVLFIYIYKNYHQLLYRVIAAIPLILSVLGIIISSISYGLSLSAGDISNYYSKSFVINASNFVNPIAYLPIALSLLAIGAFIIALYLAFKNTYKSIVAIVCFCAGFATRVIMGFSPTVFMSMSRPDLFFCFSLIICGLLLYSQIDNKEKYKQIIMKTMIITSCASFIMDLIYIISYS